MDYDDVCHLFCSPSVYFFFPQIINFDLVHAFILFVFFEFCINVVFSCFNLLVRLLTEALMETSYVEARAPKRSRLNFKREKHQSMQNIMILQTEII